MSSLFNCTSHLEKIFEIIEILIVFSFSIIDLFFFIINVYSNKHQLVLKYLKDIKVNICNVLVMTGEFNIKDRD